MEQLINKYLLAQALELEGKQFQIDMAIEECGELITELARLSRNRNNNVTEEIADVLIMVYQLRLIFGANEVDKIISEKMTRLKQRLLIRESSNFDN